MMVGKLLIKLLLAACVFSVSTLTVAQEVSPILGYWKQNGSSVYIHVTEENGVINAEMIRNDWNPGMVGQVVFQELTASKKNKWEGNALLTNSSELGVVQISLRRGEELTTRVKPGTSKRIKWDRTDPVEKRY